MNVRKMLKISKDFNQEMEDKLMRMCEVYRKSNLKLEEYYQNTEDPEQVAELISRECERIYTKVMIELSSFYNRQKESLAYVNSTDKKRQIESGVSKEIGIKAKMLDNKVVVRLPQTPVKTIRTIKIFGDELRAVMWDMVTRKGNIGDYRIKTIYILHIYPTRFNRCHIPDNDNYDTKCFIDIITDVIGGGDSGDKCRLIQDTFITDCIPEGSYYLVLPGKVCKEPEMLLEEIERSDSDEE